MTDDIFLTLSLLLMGALLARFVASLLRIPEILLLVAVGALFGPSALDVVDVPFDSLGAQLIFTLGVSLILFYGGLSLSLPILRKVWLSLTLLAVPGVVITALIVGVTAHFAFDLPWNVAFLVGAVLSPTDPAILIPLFVRSRLKPKVAQTVIAESAFNDPTGAALALTFAGVVLTGNNSISGPAGEFLVDLGISTVIGIVAGVVLSAAISSDRMGVWRESEAIAVLAVITISFFSLDTAGGSGYLGAFLAGLIVGNARELGLADKSQPHAEEVRQFAFNLADLVTLIVFMVLGANIPFAELGDNLLPALAVLATLMLVARPIVVLACAMPDRGARWTPERAALPLLDARDGGGAGRAGGRACRPGRAVRRRVRVGGGAGHRPDAAPAGAAGALAGRPPRTARTANAPGGGRVGSRVIARTRSSASRSGCETSPPALSISGFAIRFPRLSAALARRLFKLPPSSRLRQAMLRRVIQLGAEAYNRRDLEAVVVNYDPEIEYYPYREFVDAGPRGAVLPRAVGLSRLHRPTYEVWGTDVRLEPTELIDLGDRIVDVSPTCRCARRPAASHSTRHYAGVSTIRDGRVVRQDDFLTRAEAFESVGLEP